MQHMNNGASHKLPRRVRRFHVDGRSAPVLCLLFSLSLSLSPACSFAWQQTKAEKREEEEEEEEEESYQNSGIKNSDNDAERDMYTRSVLNSAVKREPLR